LKSLNFIEWLAPAQANFLLLKVNDPVDLMAALQLKGIVIRNRSKELLLENCVRITIGSPEEMKVLFNALKEYEAQL